MEKRVDTMVFETVNQKGEFFFFTINASREKAKAIFISPEFKQVCEKGKVTPTGNVYLTNYALVNNPCWFNCLPEGSTLLYKTSEFDILSEQYFSLNEQSKVVEKELVQFLNSQPEHLFKGEEYGGYNDYTASTTLAYSTLYDLLKQKVANRLGKVGMDILAEMADEEKKMLAPHKSSAKSFKVFRLGVKDEFSKLWK